MTDLQHHYKDRNPEDTIKIITDFFAQYNMQIQCMHNFQSEVDTYSAAYQLIYNSEVVMTSNGKGETIIYAQASGYSEMYERFCANAFALTFPIQYPVEELNQKLNGFRITANEKILTQEELFEDPIFDFVYSHNTPVALNQDDFFKDYIDIYYNGYPIGIPWYNFENENDIIYRNFKVYTYYGGTSGLAAGNTKEEALVQGMSELYERLTIHLFNHETYKNRKYYYIKQENLPLNIQNKLKKLEDIYGYKCYMFDLSYTYSMPVCALYVIDPYYHLPYICYGASPIVDIAMERTITEIFQGCNRLLAQAQRYPVRDNDYLPSERIKEEFRGLFCKDKMFIHEKLIIHSEEIDDFNHDIFLKQNNISNEELLNKCKQINKINNLKLYYTDISLSDKMFAYVINFDKPIFNMHNEDYEVMHNFFEVNQVRIFKLLASVSRQVKDALYADTFPTDDQLEEICINIIHHIFDEEERHLFFYLILVDIFTPYYLKQNGPTNIQQFGKLLFENNFELKENDEQFTCSKNWVKYILIYRYLQDDSYSIEEIKKILTTLGYDNFEGLTIEDFTPLFLIREIFFRPLWNTIHSEEIQTFYKALIKNV